MNNNRKKKILVLAMIVIITVIVLITILFYLGKDAKKSAINFDSFFLEKEGKYALFNSDGKQITNFIYDNGGQFDVNGIAVVKKDNKYGMIDFNGKTTVDFGKYEYINNAANLYEVIDNNHHSYLITGEGKILYDLGNYNLKTINYVVFVYDEKNIMALNFQGDVIFKKTFDKGKKFDASVFSRYNSDEWVAMIHYGNDNILYNLTAGKEILSISDSHSYYVYDSNYGSDNILIYKYLSDSPDKYNVNEEKEYKIVKDEKAVDIDSKCVNIFSASEQPEDTSRIMPIIEYDHLACSDKNQNKYWFDEKYNPVPDTTKGKTILFKDYNNYVIYDSKNSKVDFYKDGKLINTLSNKYININSHFMQSSLDIIVLEDNSSFKYEFYNSEGKKIIDKSFAKIVDYTGDEKSFVAAVSDDRRIYYLIDSSGNKISQDFDSIQSTSGYYLVEKDNKYGVIDLIGKSIIPIDKKYIDFGWKFNYLVYQDEDSKYRFYLLDNALLFSVTSNKSFDVKDNYVIAYTDEGEEFYTRDGKKFYDIKY